MEFSILYYDMYFIYQINIKRNNDLYSLVSAWNILCIETHVTKLKQPIHFQVIYLHSNHDHTCSITITCYAVLQFDWPLLIYMVIIYKNCLAYSQTLQVSGQTMHVNISQKASIKLFQLVLTLEWPISELCINSYIVSQ